MQLTARHMGAANAVATSTQATCCQAVLANRSTAAHYAPNGALASPAAAKHIKPQNMHAHLVVLLLAQCPCCCCCCLAAKFTTTPKQSSTPDFPKLTHDPLLGWSERAVH
jgi:hypothetical protein